MPILPTRFSMLAPKAFRKFSQIEEKMLLLKDTLMNTFYLLSNDIE